jgi:hypothetical protein
MASKKTATGSSAKKKTAATAKEVVAPAQAAPKKVVAKKVAAPAKAAPKKVAAEAPAAKKAAAKKVAAPAKAAPKKVAAEAPAAKTAVGGRMVSKVSPLKGMPVDAFIAEKVSGWQADVVRRLVALVKKVAPEVTATIKWGQPTFELNGPFAYVKPAKAHVTFGFWRGAELTDPKALLGEGDRMAHLKLKSADGVDEAALGALVRQAVKLNREKGDPTKRGK